MRLSLFSLLYFLIMAMVSPKALAQDAVPLRVVSEPEGAVITAIVDGVRQQCAAPCTLYLPEARPFRLRAEMENHRASIVASPQWRERLWGGYRLTPETVMVRLTPMPRASMEKYSAPSSP